jgi:phage tail-like protein
MPDTLLRSFRFQITLLASRQAVSGAPTSFAGGGARRLGDGAFQECSGLEIEQDVQEYLEGGRNDGVIRRVGRGKYQPLILKRGMFFPQGGQVNGDLWRWLQDIVRGIRPVTRHDGIIEVYSVARTTTARWEFDRGLPSRIRGPELDAKTGEVAIEEIQIAHEGLRLMPLQ